MAEQTEQSNIQLLTAKDAAQRCRLSKRSWLRFNASKKVPEPLRIGGSVRWRLSDIELWQSMDCPDRKTFEARKKGGVTNAD
ncbi:MAG: helix-turn-helix transcriptional regulator [Planctomycetota bacterium]|jgi:predicted DNA-binding transcriptional regulator AlpA